MKQLGVVKLYDSSEGSLVDDFSNNTRSNLLVTTNLKKVEVDFEWLDIMEDTIRYLDNILRNPNRFIINEEEIVKVELAKRITVESVRHLAKHTNFIQAIEDNDEVKPSKVLNINKDESYDTYENRFIYTLIDQMINYVELKKKSLLVESSIKDIKKGEYHAKSKVGQEQITMEFSYTSALVASSSPNSNMPIQQRIKRLDDDITMLVNTEVFRTLKRNHVAKIIPPIKKTNVILKNTNFQYALKLWDYLQSHIAEGAKVVKSNKEYEDNGVLKEYANDLFLLNYLSFATLGEKHNKNERLEVIEELTDNLIQKIVELNVDMPLSELQDRIGQKIAVTKFKKEASLQEIQSIFSDKIKDYLEKIENTKI